jgi:hypothetical protein
MSEVVFVVGTPTLFALWRSVVDAEQLEGNIAFAARPYVSDTPDRKKQKLLVRADLCRLVLADRIIFLNVGGSVPTDFRPLLAWCLDKGLRFEWFEPELGKKWLDKHARALRAHVPNVLDPDLLHQPKAADPPPAPREPKPEKPVKIRRPAAPPAQNSGGSAGRRAAPIVPTHPETLPAGTTVRLPDGSTVKTKQVAILARARDTWARSRAESQLSLIYTTGNGESGSLWFYPSDVVRHT